MPKAFIILRLKTVVLTVSAVLSAVAVLVLSSNVQVGIKKGLMLCANNVIPSLFLFTAVGLFISYSGAVSALGRIISPITGVLFGLTGDTATVLLLSLVSGYPVGARLLDSLYKDNKITRPKALKMLTFSVNAGPSFIVTAVGLCMLKSTAVGIRLLVTHVTATAIIAILVRLLPDRTFGNEIPSYSGRVPASRTLSDAFVSSVSDAGTTMLNICAFVVFFSAVGEIMLTTIPTNRPEIIGFLEVTVGLTHCTVKQLPLIAFMLGFGGFSVIFQVMFAAKAIAPKMGLIMVSRTVHGILSAFIMILLNTLFPISIETGTFSTATATVSNNSLPAAVSLLILCATVLMFWEKNRKSTV